MINCDKKLRIQDSAQVEVLIFDVIKFLRIPSTAHFSGISVVPFPLELAYTTVARQAVRSTQ